jgi:hypothetical protein
MKVILMSYIPSIATIRLNIGLYFITRFFVVGVATAQEALADAGFMTSIATMATRIGTLVHG